MWLETHIISSSETELFSVTTIISRAKAAELIDLSFAVKDAEVVVEWVESKLTATKASLQDSQVAKRAWLAGLTYVLVSSVPLNASLLLNTTR